MKRKADKLKARCSDLETLLSQLSSAMNLLGRSRSERADGFSLHLLRAPGGMPYFLGVPSPEQRRDSEN